MLKRLGMEVDRPSGRVSQLHGGETARYGLIVTTGALAAIKSPNAPRRGTAGAHRTRERPPRPQPAAYAPKRQAHTARKLVAYAHERQAHTAHANGHPARKPAKPLRLTAPY